MDRRIASTCVIILAVSGFAFAANVAWDETVDGDLSDNPEVPTFVTLMEGPNLVRGQIGGPSKAVAEIGTLPEGGGKAYDDGYDVFAFTVPSGFRVVDAVLISYRPTSGNLSTGYNLWLGGTGSLGVVAGTATMTESYVGYDLHEATQTGALGPGSYTVDLREYTNEDNVYAISFLLLPQPVTVRAAVMGNPTGSDWLDDIGSKLEATGLFTTVDVFELEDGIPSTSTMEGYCAVLAFTDYVDAGEDLALFGDRLADYVDRTGGLVVGMFAVGGIPITGRFDTDGYWAIDPSSSQSGPAGLGAVYEPSHPIMAGVTSFNGGTSSYRPSGGILYPGAVLIAEWDVDSEPLVAARNIGLTEKSIRRADLGFFPPSDDVRSDFWDETTDGDLLMANALRWVAETCRGPRFADGFEDGTTSKWSSSVELR